jgi:type VI secretion system protein ImpK
VTTFSPTRVAGGAATAGDLAAACSALLLAEATRLGCAGRHEEAAAVLAPALAPAAPGRSAALDLLARLLAQRGRWDEAAAAWREALELEPGNPDFAAALARLARPGAVRARALLVPLGGLVALAALVGAGAFAFGALRPAPAGSPRPTAAADLPVTATPAFAPPRAAVPVAPIAATSPPAVSLAAPGLAVRAEGDALVVSFEDGLFDAGGRLTAPGAATLASLGRQLAGHGGEVAVEVIGTTDAVPLVPRSRYHDNAELALARAAVVAGALRRSGLPLERMTLRGEVAPEVAPEGGRDPARRSARLRIVRATSASPAPSPAPP